MYPSFQVLEVLLLYNKFEIKIYNFQRRFLQEMLYLNLLLHL